MKATEKLIYTNENGEAVEFSFFSIYTVTKFTDSDLDNEITTTKTNLQDGETVAGAALGMRGITIEGLYPLEAKSNATERRLKKVLNPKLKGVLTFRDTEVERYIDVLPESTVDIIRKPGHGEFSIDLIAPFPFWKEREKTEYIALLTPQLKFSLVIPKRKGIVFGRRKPILETKVENVGDVASGFRVVFRAKGPVENPCIINKITEEKIKILKTMERGDIIEVINLPYQKQVYFNGIKSFSILDRRNSKFFTLEVGKNLIGYQADLNTINLDVIIYYSPLYL